jgi:hypothetical protein
VLIQEDLVKGNPDRMNLESRIFIGVNGGSSRDGVAKLDTFELFAEDKSLRINYTANVRLAGPGNSKVALLISYKMSLAHRHIRTGQAGFGNATDADGSPCSTYSCTNQIIMLEDFVYQPCLSRSVTVYVLENRALYPINNLRLTFPYEGVQLVIHPSVGSERPGTATEIADEELMRSTETESSPWNQVSGLGVQPVYSKAAEWAPSAASVVLKVSGLRVQPV